MRDQPPVHPGNNPHDARGVPGDMRQHMRVRSGPEVIKLFSCSTQLSMKFKMLMVTNVKMPTIVGNILFCS